MRNYKIKHSKRNIKKVFKRVFGEVTIAYCIHGTKHYSRRKPSVGQMRYLLFNYWHIYRRRYLAGMS